MAKDKAKQAPGQQSMLEEQQKPKKRRFSIAKGSKKIASKSTPEKTVFEGPKGKEFEVETTHGKIKRFQAECKSGVSSITNQPLSDADIAYRKGFVNAMGVNAREYKRTHKN